MKDRVYKFAGFELIPSEAELRNGGSSVRLQEKPLLLLTVLLDNPQRVVTRDQLRERMWDTETFVDYEQGINVAVKKVRAALCDSAENPKFIETMAKKGYRFLVSVEVSEPEIAPSKPVDRPSVPIAIPDSTSSRRQVVHHGWIVAVVAVAALAAFALWSFRNRAQQARSTQIRSLAVLPLQNLSPDSGQDYFADGITEEVITNLAQSLPLRVISRTSVMRYKQASVPMSQIARELGVEAIVEGAVARSGKRVIVTVQLIDATEDRHLWAQTYERDVGDLLGMESELAQEISSRIGVTLGAKQTVNTPKSHSVDPQVYDLCLLGRYHWNKRTAADLAQSAEDYQQAVIRDPNYAPAWAGLANAYALMPSYGSVAFQDSYEKAGAAARRALELDETLAEAHATLGFIGLNWMPDWEQAEPELRRALELNPNYATAHHWFSFYLLFVDRHDEAFRELERARQLDPLSAIINADEGQFLYGERRYEEATARLRRAIELEPRFGQPHLTLSLVAVETGHASDALKEARTALALDPIDPRTLGESGYVLAVTGYKDEAKKQLATVQEMVHRGSALPLFAALVHIGLGERKEALDALAQMANPKIRAGLQGLSQFHAFDELSSDPRYQKLLAQARN